MLEILSMIFVQAIFLSILGGIWTLIEWLISGELDVTETRWYFAFLLTLAVLSPISMISYWLYIVILITVSILYVIAMIKRLRGKK